MRGSLDVLVEAYRRGLIEPDQLRLHMTELASRNDIWISPALVKRLLNEVFGTDQNS